jgi:hypothetical protein
VAGRSVFPAIIRAEYDASGSGFAEFDRAAQQSTDRARKQFEDFYGDVKRLAADALGAQRNQAGALDLGVQKYREAADAARAQAIALREIATAAANAQKNNADNSRATQQYVQAARAAAVEAERNARLTQQQATAYDRLQSELNQTASATQALINAQARGTTANQQVVNSTRAVRQATLQAGQQLQDIGISLYSGQRASVVFAQQLPQLAFALSGLENNANKTLARLGALGTFLSGPWGLAVGLAVGVLGTFIYNMISAGDETEKTKNKQRDFLDVMRDSAASYDEVSEAAAEYAKQQEKAREVTILQAKAEALATAERLKSAIAIREQIKARLEQLEIEGKSPLGLEGAFATAVESGKFEQQLATNAALIKDLSRAASEAVIKVSDSISTINSDPTERVRTGFELLRNEAKNTIKDVDALSKRLTDLRKQEKAALDALKESERKPRKTSDGSLSDVPTVAQLSRILREEFPGTRITDGLRSKNAKYGAANSYHKIGQAVDFVPAGGMGSITKAQIRKALESRGVTIAELLGPGDKGHSNHFHVAVTKGKVALQGFIDAERDAARASEELNRSLNQIAAELDPTVRAALDYAAALEKIAALESAGRISSIDATGFRIKAVQAENARASAQLSRDSDDFFKENNIDPKADMKAIVDGIVDANYEAARKSADRFEEEMSNAIDGIARVFGRGGGRFIDQLIAPGRGADTSTKLLNAFGAAYTDANDQFFTSLNGLFNKYLGSKFFTGLSGALGAALQGYQVAGPAGAAVGGLQALFKGSTSGIGKFLGNLPVPEIQAGLALNKAIGNLLGNDQIKNGDLLNILIGPIFTKLFGSSLRGSATIGNLGGSLGITGTRGNSRSRKEAASGAAGGIISSIEQIAEQLGATINSSAGSASIGIRKKTYVLDPTGQGRTKGAGVVRFGKGEEGAAAAARAATLDLIQDGVIQGLRAGSQKLLQNAKDLEAGLSKALKFEDVFNRLKQIKDPVGAAVDALNKEFTGLKKLFEEAGASAEEFKQLEELYGLERAQAIKETSEQLTNALRSLIDDLKIGDNGLSLRDRLTNARAAFDPLAAQVRAGQTVDYEAFATAARNVLDIQRLVSGSQQGYFDVFNDILALSQQALGTQEGAINLANGIASPFAPAAAPTNASTPVVNAIADMAAALGIKLDAVNQNLGALILQKTFGFNAVNEYGSRLNF